MPMYFPDLASVKLCAKMMSEHQELKNKYGGIVPKTEADLPKARKQLGQYMRVVWHDEIAALEIELAVDRENYDKKIGEHIAKQFGFR